MGDKVRQLGMCDSFTEEMIASAVDYLEAHGVLQQIRHSAAREAYETMRSHCKCSDGECLILQEELRQVLKDHEKV